MSEKPRAGTRPSAPQNVFQVARSLYGAAFESKSRKSVGKAMKDWSELSEGERSFTLGHLLYLNLYAQASGLRVMREVHQCLAGIDESVEGLTEVVSEIADGFGDEPDDENSGGGDSHDGDPSDEEDDEDDDEADNGEADEDEGFFDDDASPDGEDGGGQSANGDSAEGGLEVLAGIDVPVPSSEVPRPGQPTAEVGGGDTSGATVLVTPAGGAISSSVEVPHAD